MEKNYLNEMSPIVDRLAGRDGLALLFAERRYGEARAEMEQLAPPDIAEILEELDEGYRAGLFRILSKGLAAEVFVEMSAESQRRLIDSFTDKELSDILSELYMDDTVDIIEEMPAMVVKRILKNSSNSDRQVINTLLRYPKNSAGSVMTTEYVRFRGNMTVAEALEHVRKVAIDKETIYTCYVTDDLRRLTGIVTAKQLLLTDPQTKLSDIMDEGVIFVGTHDDREEVAHTLEKYGFLAMPVVDSEGRLVGIITLDDAIEVLKEESEADFAKMAAITPTETPYLKTSVYKIWLARIPWLLILMISATLSSTILSGFEAALPAVLILFVPMLMDTAGNSGGQASVTVTRGISLMEVEFSDLPRVVLKELAVGAMCGLSLGLVAFGKVMLVDRLIMQNEAVTLGVALAVSLALVATIVIAKLVGCTLPILAKRIGLDPAVMASPIITTLVDAIALIIYFFIASSIIAI